MNINQAFPSKWLKASDLGTNTPTVTVAKVVMEKVGDKDMRAVMYFVGKSKALPLNRTNASSMEEITGSPDTDLWKGVKIRLRMERVDFQGKRVPAVRIEAADQQATPPPTTVRQAVRNLRQPVPEPEPAVVEDEFVDHDPSDVPDVVDAPNDDDIPF